MSVEYWQKSKDKNVCAYEKFQIYDICMAEMTVKNG